MILNWGILNGWEAPKKCLALLIISELQIKTTQSFQLTIVTMAKIKNTGDSRSLWESGERGTLLHCCCGYNLFHRLWKSVWRFLRKLDIVLPEDLEIPVPSIYPEYAPTCNNDTCFSMFISALFIFFLCLRSLFISFFSIFIRYLAHLHFQCYTNSPPYPPTPTPLPAHSPFLALAFPCSGAYKVCVSNGPLFPSFDTYAARVQSSGVLVSS
jgi:hypothetical protein